MHCLYALVGQCLGCMQTQVATSADGGNQQASDKLRKGPAQ